MTGDMGQVTGERKKIRSYKDLEIWQEGIELVNTVYTVTHNFPKEEIYGLTSQIRRAAVSIPANIAEGCARHHRNEYRQFLYIALGSLAELETLFLVAQQLEFLSPVQMIEEFEQPILQLRNKILALIRRLG